jgi:hypothetical protein
MPFTNDISKKEIQVQSYGRESYGYLVQRTERKRPPVEMGWILSVADWFGSCRVLVVDMVPSEDK